MDPELREAWARGMNLLMKCVSLEYIPKKKEQKEEGLGLSAEVLCHLLASQKGTNPGGKR